MRMSAGKFKHMVLAVAAVVFLVSCDKEEIVQPREPSVRPVKLMTIAGAATQQSNRYPAVIDAAQLADLSFPVGGLLTALPVQETQSVERGAIIASLDQSDFRNAVARAEAQFDNAEKVYQRAVRLAKEDAIARSILEERQSQRDIAHAQLASARKALSDAVLRAPFSGVIAQIQVKRLQNVQAGQLVAKLMSQGALKATIDLPARVIAQVNTRTNESASVLLDAAPEHRIPATFLEASLVADATSQTYAVTFTFEPPDHLIILPGMTATVETVSSPKQAGVGRHRVSVPLAAVMSDGDMPYVWVVNHTTMTVAKRRVTIEDGIGETVIVTEGVRTGDTIAGAGAAYLAEGMKVRPWTQ